METQWPYFKAEIKDGKILTSGSPSCFLGYEYDISGYPKPGGTWAKWRYESSQLIIENDCLGFYPLYYYHDCNCIIVSNSILKIIAECGNVELDKEALRMFVRRNYFLFDCTVYKNIKTLAPNTTIKWSKDNFSINSSLLQVKPLNLTEQQIIEGYIDHVKQAVKRNLPGNEKFIMPLSGGRDSRMILMELINNGFKPEYAVTCGELRDVELAKQICQRLELEHKTIHPREKWVKDSLRKNIRISFSTLQHDWLMALGDHVRNCCMLSYDGNGVGMFSRNAYTDEGMKYFELFRAGKYEEVEDYAFPANNPKEKFINMLPERFAFLKTDVQDLRQKHLECLFKYKIYPNDLSAFSFYANTRTAISTCPFGIMHPAKIYSPLLDYDLFSFVAALTPEQVTRNEPQALACRKAYPELKDLAFYNELNFKPHTKMSRYSKMKNFCDLTGYISKFRAENLFAALKSKYFKKNKDLRSASTWFENLLLYLSMAEFCSKQENAERMLKWLEKIEN